MTISGACSTFLANRSIHIPPPISKQMLDKFNVFKQLVPKHFHGCFVRSHPSFFFPIIIGIPNTYHETLLTKLQKIQPIRPHLHITYDSHFGDGPIMKKLKINDSRSLDTIMTIFIEDLKQLDTLSCETLHQPTPLRPPPPVTMDLYQTPRLQRSESLPDLSQYRLPPSSPVPKHRKRLRRLSFDASNPSNPFYPHHSSSGSQS